MNMSNSMGQKLIIISGSPCVGKTTVAECLLCSYENSAHLDDDWVWRVNPFLMDDPRHEICIKNSAFVLSNYLESNFDYIIFSSVRMISELYREAIFKDIALRNCSVIGVTLTCSEKTLTERHKSRGDSGEVSFEWLNTEPCPGDFVIDTNNKTADQISDEIRNIVNTFRKDD